MGEYKKRTTARCSSETPFECKFLRHNLRFKGTEFDHSLPFLRDCKVRTITRRLKEKAREVKLEGRIGSRESIDEEKGEER